jgi:DNA primase catalytic core
MIASHTEKEIKGRIEILDVVQAFLQLEKKGQNWWALSPFKTEKTPSFAVNPAKGIYHCFATGKGGDAISFLRETQGFTYPEALEWLAKHYGIELEKAQGTPEQQQQERDRAAAARILRYTVERYARLGKVEGHTYLTSRGLSQDTIEKFGLGLSMKAFPSLRDDLEDDGYDLRIAVELGLLGVKDGRIYDAYRDRAIFPIHNFFGQPVGLGARVLPGNEGPKYLNSPVSILYDKGRELYGIFQAKQEIRNKGYAILTEGYTDVLAMHQAGFRNTVAACGTALTADQVKLIRRLAQRIVFLLDGDSAGVKAAIRALPIAISEGMQVQVVTLPDGQDPDEIIKKKGITTMSDLLANAQDGVSWWISLQEMKSPAQQAQVARECAELIRQFPFSLDQELYAAQAAKLLGIPEQSMLRELGLQANSEKKSPKKAKTPWELHQDFLQEAGFPQNPDFEETKQGKIKVHFYDPAGEPVSISVQKGRKAPATWTIGSSLPPWAVYLPPGLRDFLTQENRMQGLPLFLTDVETAYYLDCAGICAAGLPTREHFVTGKNSKKLSPMVKACLALGFKRVVYLAPWEMFQLPSNRKGSERPYESRDAAQISQQYVSTLLRLKEAFGEVPVHLIHPRHDQDVLPAESDWQREFVLACASMRIFEDPRADHKPRMDMLADMASEFNFAIHTSYDSELLEAWPISDMTKPAFERILFLHQPQAFFNFHGIEKLGDKFQMGKYLYEVDRDNQVSMTDVSQDRLAVIEQDGKYWADTKTGSKPISNFTITPHLKILGGNPYILASFNLGTKSYDAVLDSEVLLSADKLYILAVGMGDLSFKGNNAQWREVQELIFRNLPAAKLQDKLGWQAVNSKESCFVFGDGVITSRGEFLPVDSQGLVNVSDQTLYLPAKSSFQLSKEHEKDYAFHRSFEYSPGETSWLDYQLKFFTAHGKSAHPTLAYTLATLYRDIAYQKKKHFPNLCLLAPSGRGKSTLVDSVKHIFGGALPDINLENSPTKAVVGSHPRQITNAPVVVKEFNVHKLIQKGEKWSVDMIKGWYDGMSRATRRSAHNEFVRNDPISAGVICEAQFDFYQYDEAVNNRFIFEEMPERKLDARVLAELKIIEARGVTHFLPEWITYRQLIAEKYADEQLETEIELRDRTRSTRVLARIVENWAMVITPLLILIKAGKIEYPLSPKAILDDAAEHIIDHARKALQKGILSEWWDFIITMYGKNGWLDDRNVFFYEKENEVRIHFPSAYQLFKKFISQSGDRSITVPSKTELEKKLMDPVQGFKEKTVNAAMGYKRQNIMGSERIKIKELYGRRVPELDCRTCLRFDNAILKLELPNIAFEEDSEIAKYDPQLNGNGHAPVAEKIAS